MDSRSTKMLAVVAALVLVAGFWLRVDGLAWGLQSDPPRSFHPDERRLAAIAASMDAGTPFPRSYVLAQPQLVRLFGRTSSGSLLPAIATARNLSLVSGFGLILLCGLLARRLGVPSGLAAALCAANTLCVIHAHFGTADSLYALALCGFAVASLSGLLFAAAAIAGFAMALKFGLVLLPSLLFLAWRHRLRGAAALGVTVLVFLAAQGFAFDLESVRAIWRSFTQDNAGGFTHAKWLNAPVYAAVLVRALGFPAAILAALGLFNLRALAAPRRDMLVALLPFVLHGAGLLAINTAFPRHALPLLPPLFVLAALGLLRLRKPMQLPAAAVAVLWSLGLAWSDGRVFREDPREAAVEWMNRNLPRESAVWTDPFWQGPAVATAAERPSQARYLVLSEAWTWRFGRSELNPFRAPGEAELYHAEPGDLAWYARLEEAVAAGAVKEAAAFGPRNLFPEQRLYDAAWGRFEKFAGRVRVLELPAATIKAGS